MKPAIISGLARNKDGVSIVEFGMIAPVLLFMLIGLFDFSYNMYSNTMLQGAIQEAARDSSIEGASASGIDADVQQAVRDIVPGATLSFSRKAYANFSDVSRPEDFSDINGDGSCNDGEPFEDINGNGTWDSDRGVAGMGGARDAVLYEVTVQYPRAFPIAAFMDISPYHLAKATTVLRNQPYTTGSNPVATENCA